MRRLLSRRFGTSFVLAAAAFGATLAAPGDADASGYLTARFGSDHGTPAMPNAYAIYFNPAALGGTKGTTLTGDVSLLLRFARYNRTPDALSTTDPNVRNDPSYVDANTGTASLTNLLALPFLGVNSDFGTKNFRAGYALYIPFGGLATWTRREGTPGVPGAQDGVQRWHNISGQILAIYNTIALAYRIPFGEGEDATSLSIGASGSPIIHNVATVRARNADGSDTTSANNQLVEGRSKLDAWGFGYAFSFGAFLDTMKHDLRFGLSYLTRPSFGETRVSGTLKTKLGTNAETNDDVDLIMKYPDIIRFGVTGRPAKDLELRADFEYVFWSTFQRQCLVRKGASDCGVDELGRSLPGNQVIQNVPRKWHDAIGVRAGPAYWLNDKTELFGSLGLTTPAVPVNTIDAGTIDSLRLYFAAGLRFEIDKHWAIAGSYNHIYFFPVDTEGRNDQNLEALGSDANSSRSPSADGKYRSQIGFLNFNVGYTF